MTKLQDPAVLVSAESDGGGNVAFVARAGRHAQTLGELRADGIVRLMKISPDAARDLGLDIDVDGGGVVRRPRMPDLRVAGDDVADFVRKINALCSSHRIGLNGAVLFQMEQDDLLPRFVLDDRSQLVLA